uniref:hypothetical protein n=1 Tax=Pontiella sp. TaxID=2837462 RepID=UPI003566C62C
MKKTGLALLIGLAIASSVHAAPIIGLVGDGNGYDETGVNDFRSTNLGKSFDLNADDVYGSHGLFFFGDGLPNDASGNDFTCHTQVGAEWATFSQAANFNGVAEGGTFSY